MNANLTRSPLFRFVLALILFFITAASLMIPGRAALAGPMPGPGDTTGTGTEDVE
jgi:hypothetical protein